MLCLELDANMRTDRTDPPARQAGSVSHSIRSTVAAGPLPARSLYCTVERARSASVCTEAPLTAGRSHRYSRTAGAGTAVARRARSALRQESACPRATDTTDSVQRPEADWHAVAIAIAIAISHGGGARRARRQAA